MLKINQIKTDWSGELPGGITWYFIGQPKSGKTTQSSKWSANGSDSVLVIDTDLGADFVNEANVITCVSLNPPTRIKMKDGVKIVQDGKEQIELIPTNERGYYHRSGPDRGKPMDVYSLAEIVADLQKNWDKYPYDTIVLDTLDQVNLWIEDAVCGEMGIKDVSEGEWGQGWANARKKNIEIVKRLQDFLKKVGGNLVLTSHSKQTAVQDNKVQLSPNLPSGLGRSICAKADVIGYTTIDKTTGEHAISFEGYDERMVGSRLKPLAHKLLPFDYNKITKEIKSYKEENNGVNEK